MIRDVVNIQGMCAALLQDGRETARRRFRKRRHAALPRLSCSF
jgi:hypothetical protein